jgi:hypothetical protein
LIDCLGLTPEALREHVVVERPELDRFENALGNGGHQDQ